MKGKGRKGKKSTVRVKQINKNYIHPQEGICITTSLPLP